MVTTTHTLPPEAHIYMEGKTYGGAYWEVAEFDIVLTALTPDVWRVELQDSGGHAVHTLPLTQTHAMNLIAVANSNESLGVPGLQKTVTWDLGDTDNEVRITDFDEIVAWLAHFLNGDWPTDAPEWEF